MIFNMTGGGGSSSEIYAVLKTMYPVGSTCTATNGVDVLTAPDTSGLALFAIPEPKTLPETWTVTVTNGTNTKSQSVEITAKGQIESVELGYSLYIVENGVSSEVFVKSGKGTGGTSGSYITFKGGTAAWSPEGCYYYPVAVDLTGYTTLYFEGYAVKNANEEDIYALACFYAGTTETDLSASQEIGWSEEVLSLDVAALEGEYYVGLYTKSAHSSLEGKSKNATIYAKNIWLE